MLRKAQRERSERLVIIDSKHAHWQTAKRLLPFHKASV
jgi:hypothetical protein